MVKTGGPRGRCRRCKTANFDTSNMSASCPLRTLARDVSRFFSYACHRCKGGLNLNSGHDNLHVCARALLQSAAGSLCARKKNAPSQRRAAVTIRQAALNTRLVQTVELAFTILRRFRFLHSSIVSLHAHSLPSLQHRGPDRDIAAVPTLCKAVCITLYHSSLRCVQLLDHVKVRY